jgi:transcription-repair coupling factor (superfamily II helicase)
VLAVAGQLGAGFNLASHDLDLRGAGNLLGEEQSGHIKEVGYELYQQMLEETIAKLKSGELQGLSHEFRTTGRRRSTLGVPVMIPEDYMPTWTSDGPLPPPLGPATKVEIEGFAAELIDRFGPLPKEVNTLMLIVRIKAMCKRAGISRLDAGPKGATVQFHNDKFANPAGLVEFLRRRDRRPRCRATRSCCMGEMKSEAERIKGAFAMRQNPLHPARSAAAKTRDKDRTPASSGSGVPLKASPTGIARTTEPTVASGGDHAGRQPGDMADRLHRQGVEVAHGQAHHREHRHRTRSGRPGNPRRRAGPGANTASVDQGVSPNTPT